jgi:hypothetical protein
MHYARKIEEMEAWPKEIFKMNLTKEKEKWIKLRRFCLLDSYVEKDGESFSYVSNSSFFSSHSFLFPY